MQKYKTPAVVLSVLLAIVIPLLTAAKAQRDLSSYPIVKFDIEPYDPRDLMYGHYMQFKFKWNWKDGKPQDNVCSGDNCCLCVESGEKNPEVSLAVCPPMGETLPTCRHLIRGGYYSGDSFITDINRYYVDETIALPLEKSFRDGKLGFSVGLGMNPNGKPVLEKLYLNDMALKDFLGLHGGIADDPNYKDKNGEVPVPKEPTP